MRHNHDIIGVPKWYEASINSSILTVAHILLREIVYEAQYKRSVM